MHFLRKKYFCSVVAVFIELIRFFVLLIIGNITMKTEVLKLLLAFIDDEIFDDFVVVILNIEVRISIKHFFFFLQIQIAKL